MPGSVDGTRDERTRELLAGLLAESEATLRELQDQQRRAVEASRDSNADDEHDPEGATLAFEREQLTALIQRTGTARDEVAAALDRLDAGRYGACEGCGRSIGAGRLEARPAARLCIDCAAG